MFVSAYICAIEARSDTLQDCGIAEGSGHTYNVSRKKCVLSGTVSNEVHKRAQAPLSHAFTLARGTPFSSQFEEMQQRVMDGLIRIQNNS